MRYAVPVVAACLKSFAKKELITDYESAILNLGISSFVHVKYGDKEREVLPDKVMLNQLQQVFASAMNVKNGVPLATTNVFCSAEVIQPDMNDLFEDDHYATVNSEILSAGGISGIIVSGISDSGSTFASAQVSMQTAAIRIKQARDNFCELMNKVNLRLNGVLPRSSTANIPRFTFPPVDLAGNEKFQKTCMALWKEGVISTRTLLQNHGYDAGQEMERLQQEGGAPQAGKQPESQPDTAEPKGKPGRPPLDDAERTSDPSKAMTGKQPKPSNPEGSQNAE